MSVVANVILSFSIWEDERDRIADVNRFFERVGAKENRGDRFIIPPDSERWVGGTKALERPTFVAAFNYLDTEALVAHLATIGWDAPDEVQLFVCEQDEDGYRLRYGREGQPE